MIPLFFTLSYFNSHAHVERDVISYSSFVFIVYFNSHAHVERDLKIVLHTECPGISTHTLTWSVTVYACPRSSSRKISTHTLTWSVTTSWDCASCTISISTHTLTWSVTWEPLTSTGDLLFQLTRSRGAWPRLVWLWTCTTWNFNSHAHVERDLQHSRNSLGHVNFNSHAHVERDLLPDMVAADNIFQLTRSRGAWRRLLSTFHRLS